MSNSIYPFLKRKLEAVGFGYKIRCISHTHNVYEAVYYNVLWVNIRDLVLAYRWLGKVLECRIKYLRFLYAFTK